jgi:mevalonate kinase
MTQHSQHHTDPAHQQLEQMGADRTQLQQLHALGISGDRLKELLGRLLPVILGWVADQLGGGGGGGGVPMSQKQQQAPPQP